MASIDGPRKVAILSASMGSKAMAPVLQHLTEDQKALVMFEIAKLDKIVKESKEQVFAELAELLFEIQPAAISKAIAFWLQAD
jgi:flagellar motor switch protein FliG